MHPVETFELVLALLAGVVALHWAARRIGLPPATALLVGGGGLAFIPGLPPVALDPELALVLFLPPLLMDGAYYTAFGRFRRHLPGILSLAVGAVVFTTLAVGLVVHWLVPGLPWAACFALGAIVSPPDAVSARAVLQGVTLPRRLSALLEGESLLNDATGLVLFRFAVVATLSGVFSTGAAVSSFFFLAFGGIVVGLLVSAVWMFVVRRLSDQTLIIMANTLICWVAYIAGEMVQVSGVIATVVAGLVLGWYQHIIFPAQVRLRGSAFWQTLVFVLEALVFILIGFSLRGVLDRVGGIEAVSATMAVPILGVVLTVVLARFVWVFGSDGLLSALRGLGLKRARPLGMRQATVLGWAGMRGVVTLAVALTLPASMPGRDLMLVIAFAVIFATVVVQGTSLGWLIRQVRPVDQDPPAKMTMAQSEAAIAGARNDAVEAHAYAPDGTLIHPQLLEQSRKRLDIIQRYAADADTFMEGARTHFDVVLIALAAGRAELIRIHRAGLIEDEVLHDLERDLDVEELGIILQRGD
ncbi:Na+/H+ antiporter [Sphingomonas alpina]|uniref:Na+/H+ antiporter n=1 Tax=Sphingomonas alpina TaxID=653931 RepID=A0A7H0LL85_9SPHN|nr:Na+/H+ antiporter [Sphingomonas alpina]QNQ10438.1 Na+/H+ antiporter [Sphingomonas alpina]